MNHAHHHPIHVLHPASTRGSFLHRHSLGLAAVGFLLLWIVLYCVSDPATHWGSFFGNAIADWSGVVVTVIGTKYLFERGSAESRQCPPPSRNRLHRFVREHSLTIFMLATGALWVLAFRRMDPNARWGQVVGNVVSEWTQQVGMVLMTKKLMEEGSKESAK